MAAKRDYYEVLGVPRDVEPRALKSAYRKLAMKFHPDRNPGDADAEERFKEAAEAYEVLSDDRKRAMYDRAGFDGLKSGGFQPGFSGDIGDIFGQFGDLFAEFFGGQGFGGFQGGPRPTVGADLRFDLEISLEEAFSGTNRNIEVKKTVGCETCGSTGAKDGALVTCDVCAGRGQVVQGRGGFMIATTCRACNGRGKVARELCSTCDGVGAIDDLKKLDVKVPPGVDTGVRLRLQGEGDAGTNGGPPGDLYVFVAVQPHDMFVRQGPELHCELAVSFTMACVGGDTLIPRLNGGEIEVAVPAGMQPGDTVRVAEGGMPRLGGRGIGDLVVHLTIQVPSSMTDPQRKLLEQLDEAMPIEPEFSASGGDRRETRRNRRRKGGSFFDRLRDAFEGD
ncbi:MAG: molecular chaperone DnaJ [Myxococcota bacterium]